MLDDGTRCLYLHQRYQKYVCSIFHNGMIIVLSGIQPRFGHAKRLHSLDNHPNHIPHNHGHVCHFNCAVVVVKTSKQSKKSKPKAGSGVNLESLWCIPEPAQYSNVLLWAVISARLRAYHNIQERLWERCVPGRAFFSLSHCILVCRLMSITSCNDRLRSALLHSPTILSISHYFLPGVCAVPIMRSFRNATPSLWIITVKTEREKKFPFSRNLYL